MTAFMPVSVLNQNRMVILDFLSCCLLARKLTIVSKRWPTRPFSLNLLGSAEEFGHVGIYPRHWYSYSLNYTCFRELNVLFFWVAYVNISQEQGFRKIKFDIASASRRSWYESETSCKQDPKTFQSSSNLDLKVKWYLGLLNRFSF